MMVSDPPDPEPSAAGDTPPPDWSTPDTPVTTPPLGGWSPGAPPEPAAPTTGATPATTLGPSADIDPFIRKPGGERRLWVLLGSVSALLMLCCVGTALGGLLWGPEVYHLVRDRQRPIGLNEVGRDGDLEFRVHLVQCGIGRIGDPFVNRPATGQFCVVRLSVTNRGAAPVTFVEGQQKAYGPDGELFRVDPLAGLVANAGRQLSDLPLDVGAEATGLLVYDIPIDARIVRLRLHAAAGSPGLLVRTG
jgi:hypothetical protein